MNKPKSVSSKDVAREAGVSQATVSYVLNNVKGISIKPETREAVLNAAQKLNYHPDLIARSMRLKKSMSVGVVTGKDMSSYIFMNALEGIKDALKPRNYSITLCLNKPKDEDNGEYIRYFNSNRIDGIIFAYASLTDEQIDFLLDSNIPFVIIDTNTKDEIKNLVKTDMTRAITEAVSRLHSKGIQKIGYIGPGAGDSGNRRYRGYLKGLEINNIAFDESIVYRIPNTGDDFETSFDEYFNKCNSIPPAVICDRVNLSFNFLKYAAQKGIRVPDDMAVVGIGTSQFSEFSYPSLSAIEAPLYDIGYSACNMLFNAMEGNASNDVMVLEWKFAARDST